MGLALRLCDTYRKGKRSDLDIQGRGTNSDSSEVGFMSHELVKLGECLHRIAQSIRTSSQNKTKTKILLRTHGLVWHGEGEEKMDPGTGSYTVVGHRGQLEPTGT